jgi:hypothetical protein
LFRISSFEFVILFVLGAFASLREIDPVRIRFLSRQGTKQSLVEIQNEAGLERCNFGVIYYFVETQNLQCRRRATSGD